MESLSTTLAVSTSSLSFLGSVYICVIYVLGSKNHDRKTFRRAVFLAVSDGLSSLFWLLNYADARCEAIGALKLYAFLSNSFWGLMLSLSILRAFWQSPWLKWIESSEWIQHVICWTAPLIPAVISVSIGSLGKDEYWCWMTRDFLLARALLYDLPAGCIVIANVLVYSAASWKFRKIYSNSRDTAVAGERRKRVYLEFHLTVNAFLLVHFISWLFLALVDLFAAAWPEHTPTVMVMCAGISPLPGLINAIIFNADTRGKHSEVRNSLETADNSVSRIETVTVGTDDA